MFVENVYPGDTRVRNESELLTEAGYAITVVAMRGKGQRAAEVVNGVQVYRIPRLELFKKTPAQNPTRLQRFFTVTKSFVGYFSEYVYFTGTCFVMSLYVALKHGFDVIHSHNPPDTLWLVAAPYKLLGKKYVFDHHDLCPELYRSRYGSANGLVVGLLKWIEWGNLKLADVMIATNESYREIEMRRGKRKAERIFVVRNGPNRGRMGVPQPSELLRAMNKHILCYVGALNPQDGLDYLLRSLRHLAFNMKRRDFYCVVMGSGDSLDDLRVLARDLDLNGLVELTGYVSDEDLLANLAAADLCLDPDPSSPLNDVSTWIKIMEYMAFGKPIVAYDLKETRFSAQGAAVYVEPNNEAKFAEAIAALLDEPARRAKMGQLGRTRVESELQWSVVGKNLLAAYDTLLSKKLS